MEPKPANETQGTIYSERTPDDGVIRLEKWPEGYELWYHGEIVWRSYEVKGKERK